MLGRRSVRADCPYKKRPGLNCKPERMMQVQPLQVLTTSYGAYYITACGACQIHANLALAATAIVTVSAAGL